MDIQWYPVHMTKARRAMEESLKLIDLIIELESWDENKAYDRIGLQDDEIEIMGVRVPHQTMPIKPGRNLAIIVEVAARNFSLKRSGYNAARELIALMNDETNN